MMLTPPTMADVLSPLAIDLQASFNAIRLEEQAVRIVMLLVQLLAKSQDVTLCAFICTLGRADPTHKKYDSTVRNHVPC